MTDLTVADPSQGFPRLWCPLLAFYRPDGSLNVPRMMMHFAYVRPYVRGFLVPGSTGDGWLMNDVESRAVLAYVLRFIGREALVSIGALKTTTEDTCRFITETEEWLQGQTGEHLPTIAGYTVCPPVGADLSQQEIEDALAQVLSLGYPTTLYQLPQVTQNAMSPETVARLAARFSNFVLFKDSSGADTVALAAQRQEVDLGRVFLVRGAEGDYAKWLKKSGGPYDGYLLSTANCFPRELHTIVEAVTSGKSSDPDIVQLAERVSGCVADAFAAVAGVNAPGNAFTHANKALDHFMAHGPDAPLDPDRLPILYSGVRLSQEVVQNVREALVRWGLMPQVGYFTESAA